METFHCSVCFKKWEEEPSILSKYGVPQVMHICPKLKNVYANDEHVWHESTALRVSPVDHQPKWRWMPSLVHWIKPNKGKLANLPWWFYFSKTACGIYVLILGLKVVVTRE